MVDKDEINISADKNVNKQIDRKTQRHEEKTQKAVCVCVVGEGRKRKVRVKSVQSALSVS